MIQYTNNDVAISTIMITKEITFKPNNGVGPFFIEGDLTGQKYKTMVRAEILPAIQTWANNKMSMITVDVLVKILSTGRSRGRKSFIEQTTSSQI